MESQWDIGVRQRFAAAFATGGRFQRIFGAAISASFHAEKKVRCLRPEGNDRLALLLLARMERGFQRL